MSTSPRESGPQVAQIAPRLMLGLLVGVVFFPVVRFGFLDWDDLDLVVTNPYLDLSWDHLRHLWTQATLGLYTPLAYTLWGLLPREAWAFHLLNVLLHLGVTWVVYDLLRQRGGMLGAWLGAAWFAVHPLHVEPVAWVSGMNNLLAALLMLLAIRVFQGEATLPWDKSDPLSRAHRPRYLWATLLLAAALFSKPTAVVTPLLLMVWTDRWDRKMWRATALWYAMAAAFAVAAANIQPAADTPKPEWFTRPAVVLDAIGFYLTKMVYPHPLTPDAMRRPDLIGWFHPYVLIGLAGLWLAWRTRAVRVMLVPLVPVLGVVSFEFQSISTVADRYAYVSVLGLSMLIATGVDLGKRLKVAGLLGLLICVVLSMVQVGKWASTSTLFGWAMKIQPGSAVAPRVLGFAAARSGNTEEAESYYRTSLANRDEPLTHLYLANLLRTRLPDEALAHYTRANEAHSPTIRSRALTNRGILHAQRGRTDLARTDFQAAIDINPGYAPPYANLALLTEPTDPSRARELFLQALERDPTLSAARAGLERLR